MLGAAAYFGPSTMAIAVVLLSGVFAFGYPQLIGITAPRGAAIVIGATAVAASSVMLWAPGGAMTLPVVLAFGVMGAFLEQMLRTHGREQMIESVAGTIAGVVIAVSGAGWIGAIYQLNGPGTILVSLAALVIAAAALFLPVAPHIMMGAVITAPMLGAALFGMLIPGMEPLALGGLGFAAGAVTATARLAFEDGDEESSPVAAAAAIIPILALGVPVMQAANFAG